MKATQDMLDRLGRLSAADRVWILQALSDRAKGRLRQVTAALPNRSLGSHGHPPEPETPEAFLQRAAWLAGEPAWILALVLGSRAGPWQARLLAKLAPGKRREVLQLRAGLPPLSKKMEQALARALREQSPAAPLPASFEDAFERERVSLWRRSRRVSEVGA